jgi:cytochrome c
MSFTPTELRRAGGICVLTIFGAAACLPVLSQAQTARAGRELWERRCGGCHALDRDKEGPRLGGVYGRKAAAVRSFRYSDALKMSNIVWDREMLDKWLTDPERLVPGNDMAFRDEKPDEREQIIDFLRQNSGK